MLDELQRRLDIIERRLADLEMDSHPPVDNTKAIRKSIAAILRRAAEAVSDD